MTGSTSLSPVRYLSFCSGIEAATVAWGPLGWSPIAFCEIDPFASIVLKHHYPTVPNLGDFTKIDWEVFGGLSDICVGGTPCQAFSVAGLRQSLSDERGNLTLEFVNACNKIKPKWVVWENVPGVLSTRDNAFGCFLGGLVGSSQPLVSNGRWPDAGVVDGPERRAAWRVLDAQYFGLAQRRRRVFVVAGAGDGPHPAEILFEWESLRRDSPPRREAGEGVARGIEIGPSGGGFTDVNPTLDARCKDGPIRNQLAGAVAMFLNAGGMNRIDAESETLVVAQMAVRRLTPRECERLQGFPDDYTLIPGLRKRKDNKRHDARLGGFLVDVADGPRYKAIGNSMAVPVMRWIGERIQELGGLR